MPQKQWYERLFENYARSYENECYVHGTAGECDFLERELDFDKSKAILDIGCGTGRHAVELARRGYTVTGIDLSESMLSAAREKAARAGLSVDFRRCDARNLPFDGQFEVAIMLCEGGFSLMETDEMNYKILQSAARALKPQGTFIFTALNGLFPLSRYFKGTSHSVSAQDGTFDLMTLRDHTVHTFTDDDGRSFELACNERYYLPTEIEWLLKSLGFASVEIFGSKLGAYSRSDKLTPDDFEMLVIAKK